MRRLTVLIAACFSVHGSLAQLPEADKLRAALTTENPDTVAWLHSGTFSLGINQGFLHNWQAGGEVAALNVNTLFNGTLTRLYHNQVWSNNLDLTYGLYYAYSNAFVPRKVDDRIDLTSKYGLRLKPGSDFFLAGLFNFRSQFTAGYDYSLPQWDTLKVSRFMSPGYFITAAGIEYRQGAVLTLFLSPVAGRLTVAEPQFTRRSPAGAFGIPFGKNHRYEMGAYFSGRYRVETSKTITYTTRLDFYSNYLAKDRKDSIGNIVKRDNPGNIDLLWDNLLTLKIGKYISLNLAATFIYDNDVPYDPTYKDGPGAVRQKDEPGGNALGWWQIKQQLSGGFTYRF